MSSIQQTYATHCTYASSAIERRETGDVRDRVLGYSARASSYSQADLRRHFRTIERFLYYYLPKDTPPDKKQSLTPQAAPHRLFFCPAVSGLQALGHITYRQTDCAGRVGSYFGHVLTADANGTGGPWDVIECLQLWNAPGWVLEDSPAFSYDLPPLPALSSLRSGSDRPLDERVLWSFLNTPPGGSFHAPDAKLIPDRWRQMPVADRQRFFRLALTGYLEAASQPRESLLLLAEPPIAVLFFYGIARLLPAELRTALSFSTFEATADRLITALAALTFDDERAGGDVPDERYKRGFVVNTWRADRASPLRYTQGRYADLLLSPLVGRADTDAANLAESIDHILARFQAVGVTQAAELEPLARAHAAVRQIFEPGAGPPPDDSWQKSPPQRAYVMKAVRQQLRGTPNAALLDRLLKSPEHLPLIFEFALSAAGEDDCAESLTYLVERVEPLEQLDQLLGGGEEARRYKLHALRHYVATHRRLPHPCRWLWTPPSVQHGSPRPPLLFELLHSPETTAQVLRDSLGGVPDEALNLLFRDVLTGGLDASDRRDILTRLAGRPAFNIQSLVGELVAKLAAHADVLRPVLVPHLCKLLEQLPDQPSRFAETMALLEIAQPLWTGAAAAAGIHGWLDLKKKVDGYQQQAGAQSSVLGRGAKGFGPWEFEQQAGTLLIPWVSSLGPPQSARDRSQKIAALLCGLAKDSGIGHCLSQESEPYLAAVLRKDEAEQKRIREAVAAAQAEKEERTTQRLSSVTKLLATTLIVLLAVLLGIFLWREIGARHGPATGLEQTTLSGREQAAGPPASQPADPMPKPGTTSATMPQQARDAPPDGTTKAPPPQTTPASGPVAPRPAVRPSAKPKETAKRPELESPVSAGGAAAHPDGDRPPAPNSPFDTPEPPKPPPRETSGPSANDSVEEPQARPSAAVQPAVPTPKEGPAPEKTEPTVLLPAKALVAEPPSNDMEFMKAGNVMTILKQDLQADVEIRFHGLKFLAFVSDRLGQQVEFLGRPPRSDNGLEVCLVYNSAKNVIALFYITNDGRQLRSSFDYRPVNKLLPSLQSDALQYSVVELAPSSRGAAEDPIYVALVKPVQHTFTLCETGPATAADKNLQAPMPKFDPRNEKFSPWNKLYLGSGLVIDAKQQTYHFGDSWEIKPETEKWAIPSLAQALGLDDIRVRVDLTDGVVTLSLEPTIYSNELEETRGRVDDLTQRKNKIENLLRETSESTADGPTAKNLRHEQNFKKLTDWYKDTDTLCFEIKITDPSSPPKLPKRHADLVRQLDNSLEQEAVKAFDEELRRYQAWVRGTLLAETRKEIDSLQQEIENLKAAHGDRRKRAKANEASFANWLKDRVKVQAVVYRLVPYGALGHDKQPGDPDHIRVIVIKPEGEAAGAAGLKNGKLLERDTDPRIVLLDRPSE